jgi:GNAT superfamily N-acetyltransferase
VYDRIVTAPEHRRRGLGRALMHALGAARRSASSTQVLVATAEGMALYGTLGWELRSLFTTAAVQP